MAISICTTNRDKVSEFARILGVALDPVAVELEEVQSLDTERVCRKKAEAAFAQVQRPVLVDDTGFELVALAGFPGALVTWALGADGTGFLHRMVPSGGSDAATVVTAIGYADEAGIQVFVGRLDGRVIPEARGHNGFGFDGVFIPDGMDRTLAEMTDAEKDEISPRRKALDALASVLRGTILP